MAIQEAQITGNKRLSSSVTLLGLALEDREVFRFKAGQFVVTRPAAPSPPQPPPPTGKETPVGPSSPLGSGGGQAMSGQKPLKGFFSIASAEQAKELSLLVEHRHDGGPVSEWMSGLQPGERIQVEGPMGKFTLGDAPAGPLAFFCSKAGLAPCRSLCLSSLNSGSRQAHHLFLGGQGEDLLMDRQWRELAQAQANFHYHPGGDAAAQALASLPKTGTKLFLAGFNREVEPLQAALLAAGFEAAAMHVEKFG